MRIHIPFVPKSRLKECKKSCGLPCGLNPKPSENVEDQDSTRPIVKKHADYPILCSLNQGPQSGPCVSRFIAFDRTWVLLS